MKVVNYLFAVCLLITIQSCEFSCSVGNKDKDTGVAVIKDGAKIYNNIQLNASGIAVDKAYLFLESGKRVPDNNFVDFKETINLQLKFAGDWNEENGKVFLGASEKIISENGDVVLEEEDLFVKYPEGISVKDSKSIYLSAILKMKEGATPTSFTVYFKVWDKRSEAFVEGNYQLFSK